MKIKKIAVLDGYTTVLNNLNWDSLNQFGDVVAYDRTPKEKIIERAIDAQAVLTNKVPFFKEQIEQLSNLKYIGVLATGYNNVDLDFARERGIVVTNIPAYGTDSVAQTAFAHILNIANSVELHSQAVHNGEWTKSPDPCLCLTPIVELSGKTLGIIGYGAIGKKIAVLAKSFGMNVVAYSPSRIVGTSDEISDFKSVDDIFKCSDILSLNCPLNSSTDKIINNDTINLMKNGVWIINTGRGGLIDELALAEALKSGKVGAAGVDVLSAEPPSVENPLLNVPNCHITSHNAWMSKEARQRLINIAVENLKAFIDDKPINVVNK